MKQSKEKGAAEGKSDEEKASEWRKKRAPSPGPAHVPGAAALWQAQRKGEHVALGAKNAEGVTVYQWPIEVFRPTVLRDTWGPGSYRVQFRDRSGASAGSRDYTVAEPDAAVGGSGPAMPAEVPAVAVAVVEDPLGRAIDNLGKVQAIVGAQAAIAIEQTRQHEATILQLAMGRRDDAAAGTNALLVQTLQGISAKLDALESRVRRYEEGETNDEEDDDEDDDDDDGDEDPSEAEVTAALAVLQSQGVGAALREYGQEKLIRMVLKVGKDPAVLQGLMAKLGIGLGGSPVAAVAKAVAT